MNEELEDLQDKLATIDLLTRRGGGGLEFLIKRYQSIRLRMDGDLNHKRPHIHVDYGRELHTAAYAIDDGERLVGGLPTKYDRQIKSWIDTNRSKLLQAWAATQSGKKPDVIIAELMGSEFGE